MRITPLLLLIACGPLPQPDPGPDAGAVVEFDDPVTVQRVIDGDTVEVRRGENVFRVRLKGVNTPEMNFSEPTVEPEPWADEARMFTIEKAGLQVGYEVDSACTNPEGFCEEGRDDQPCFDRYCRRIGYLRLRNGADLGEALLREGLARLYRFNDEVFDRLTTYQQAEAAAQSARLGLWE